MIFEPPVWDNDEVAGEGTAVPLFACLLFLDMVLAGALVFALSSKIGKFTVMP